VKKSTIVPPPPVIPHNLSKLSSLEELGVKPSKDLTNKPKDASSLTSEPTIKKSNNMLGLIGNSFKASKEFLTKKHGSPDVTKVTKKIEVASLDDEEDNTHTVKGHTRK
jgi:hypothetical protein